MAEGDGQVGLLTLDDSLLVELLSYASLRDVCEVASVCKRLHGLVRSREDLWACKVKQLVSEQIGKKDIWKEVKSYRVLCQFLVRYLRLEGAWAGDVQPRGQLLRVEYEEGGLVGQRYLLDYSPSRRIQEVMSARLFRLEPVEVEGVLEVRCIWYRRPHAGVSADGDELLEDSSAAAPSDGHRSINILKGCNVFELMRPTLDDVGEEMTEDTLARFRLYVARGVLPPERWPRYTQYKRLQVPDVAQDSSEVSAVEESPDLGIAEGLYWALYGEPLFFDGTCQEANLGVSQRANDYSLPLKHNPHTWALTSVNLLYIAHYVKLSLAGYHGPEILEVLYEGNSIVGRKVTGDPNVPCGKISFSVERTGKRASQIPSQMLSVFDSVVEEPDREIQVIYDGTGRVASVSYRNPETIPAKMLQYRDGNFAILFSNYGLVLDFKPLSLPPCGRILGSSRL